MSENKTLTVENKKLSNSERFTQMVMKQYGGTGLPYSFTEREKQLIRNYFIGIDQTLMKTEAERIRKNAGVKPEYQNTLPYIWQNVDLETLAQDLAHYARVGLDMLEDNMLFPIPYKDNKGQKYTMTLMEGYNGIRYQAEKYALDPFKGVTVEVVHQNDKFLPVKKSRSNPVEGYEFEIPNPFDRGEIVGVFGYIQFEDETKNKLVVFSTADVMKRKPKYASAEFWGGRKKVWKGGKQVEEETEGWLAEMYEKTMKREIYSSKHIPRDPAKIDDSYQYIRSREMQYADIAVEAEVIDHGNAEPLTLPAREVEDAAVVTEAPAAETPPETLLEIAQEVAPAPEDDEKAPF